MLFENHNGWTYTDTFEGTGTATRIVLFVVLWSGIPPRKPLSFDGFREVASAFQGGNPHTYEVVFDSF